MGDDSHLLIHGIDEQLTTATLSRKERFSSMDKGVVGYPVPCGLEKVNVLLKVVIVWYECEITRLEMRYGEIMSSGKK